MHLQKRLNACLEGHNSANHPLRMLLDHSRDTCLAIGSTALLLLPAQAAIFDVTNSDWGDASTTNSLAWAIQQANTIPGFDTIRFLTNVSVDNAPPDFPNSIEFIARFTDPSGLRLEGNGHTLLGNPMFTTSIGTLVTKQFPREFSSSGGDSLLISSSSFATIADNVAKIEVENLTVDGLNAFLSAGRNTVISIVDSTIKNAVNFGGVAESMIYAGRDSVVNIVNVTMSNINSFREPTLGAEYFWGPAVLSGSDMTFNISNSTFDLRRGDTPGVLFLAGGTANIVSSVVLGRGLSISDDVVGQQGVLNFVNSLFRPEGSSATARIQAYFGAVANIIGSTIQFDAQDTNDVPSTSDPFIPCPDSYPCNGAPLQAFGGATINLQSSAVSALYTNIVGITHPYSNIYNMLPGYLTSDRYSFVQPVANQTADDLKALFTQPQLLTSGTPYVLAFDPFSSKFHPTYEGLTAGGYPAPSGPLLDAIPDADTLNVLTNPIDGSVITQDLFGNPRSFQGRRDIGAVQATQTPGPLPLLGFGAAMGWSRRLRQRVRAAGSKSAQTPQE